MQSKNSKKSAPQAPGLTGGLSGPANEPQGRAAVANFGGPGVMNAEMNRSDSIPSKPGLGITMGAKSGA